MIESVDSLKPAQFVPVNCIGFRVEYMMKSLATFLAVVGMTVLTIYLLICLLIL